MKKAAPNRETIEVHLSFPEPHRHRIAVRIELVAPSDDPELAFATWTPGSYLIREYARNVEDVSAGRRGITKTAKNAWRVRARRGERVVITYRVYANEISVRTPYLDEHRGFVVPAAVIPFVRGQESAACRVEVEPPAGWRVDAGLPREGLRNVFLADDFDHLVDGPIELGRFESRDFRLAGRGHRITLTAGSPASIERFEDGFRRIIAATRRVFGGLPYDRYLLIVHVLEHGRGGLEHRDSAVTDITRASVASGAPDDEVLGLIAHEYFHTWNVKRIKPAAFVPYDYERECYTRLLWAMEGTTSYFEWLLLLRAGLMTRDRYLARLADKIGRAVLVPGRKRTPLSSASFDAWIQHYRPDEHSPNRGPSYYEKGELVALLLDLELRRASDGRRSYDDLMRGLWNEYGRQGKGIPENGYRAAAEAIAGRSLRSFFARYVDGTADPDWDAALAAVGFRIVWSRERKSWLGVRTERADGGRVQIKSVLDGSPAAAAGLSPRDELVAIDGRRVETETLERHIADAKRRLRMTIFRDNQLLDLVVRPGAAPPRVDRIEIDRQATPAARRLGRAWLPDIRLKG